MPGILDATLVLLVSVSPALDAGGSGHYEVQRQITSGIATSTRSMTSLAGWSRSELGRNRGAKQLRIERAGWPGGRAH